MSFFFHGLALSLCNSFSGKLDIQQFWELHNIVSYETYDASFFAISIRSLEAMMSDKLAHRLE